MTLETVGEKASIAVLVGILFAIICVLCFCIGATIVKLNRKSDARSLGRRPLQFDIDFSESPHAGNRSEIHPVNSLSTFLPSGAPIRQSALSRGCIPCNPPTSPALKDLLAESKATARTIPGLMTPFQQCAAGTSPGSHLSCVPIRQP